MRYFFILICFVLMEACSNGNADQAAPPTYEKGSFGYDQAFLQQHDSNVVTLQLGSSAVLVSARYQAKVFTSTASGPEGYSFGWINYSAFTAPEDPHMNAYGGENRFWLGPEGGHYSVFFAPGAEMVFRNWKTPAPVDTEAWNLVAQDDRSVTMDKEMQVQNYAGGTLSVKASRIVKLFDRADIESQLGITLHDSLQFVGYATENSITNTGSEAWTEKTGMPCIWILDMFQPSDATTIVVPFKPGKPGEKVATTNYFGEIDSGRLRIAEQTLYFRADGKSRGKLGILPPFVLPFAGSYDSEKGQLTITRFTVDPSARYLYQGWNTNNPVFSGDAMNAYNDGPLEDGKQMGPFYELESVSPAANLKPGESQHHTHEVYHFTGDRESLDKISRKLLGVSLQDIVQAFGS